MHLAENAALNLPRPPLSLRASWLQLPVLSPVSGLGALHASSTLKPKERVPKENAIVGCSYLQPPSDLGHLRKNPYYLAWLKSFRYQDPADPSGLIIYHCLSHSLCLNPTSFLSPPLSSHGAVTIFIFQAYSPFLSPSNHTHTTPSA